MLICKKWVDKSSFNGVTSPGHWLYFFNIEVYRFHSMVTVTIQENVQAFLYSFTTLYVQYMKLVRSFVLSSIYCPQFENIQKNNWIFLEKKQLNFVCQCKWMISQLTIFTKTYTIPTIPSYILCTRYRPCGHSLISR